MAVYAIKVDIDAVWVHKFNESGTMLCFSHGVLDSTGTDELSFNVVGTTEDVMENVDLSWTDKYEIAGGKQSFSAGTDIKTSTNPAKIKFRESVTMNVDKLLDPAQPDTELKEGQLKFINKVIASCYLYKHVTNNSGNDVLAPFYITKSGPNPPGYSVLTPKPVARLYFAKNYISGTMIDNYQSEYIDIDLTGKTTAVVKYDAMGVWKQES